MKATLEITPNPYGVKLTLPVDLEEPEPTEHLPILDEHGTDHNVEVKWQFIYREKIAVHTHRWVTGRPVAVIETMSRSGKGQTRLFDLLVGPNIASARLALGRQARLLAKENGYDDTQTMDVHVTQEDVERMREMIQGYADGHEPEFCFQMFFNSGMRSPYTG